MKLSRVERWILWNQFLILEKLYPEEASWYEEARTAIGEGYELEYPWYSEHIYEDVMSSRECQEVIDILTMFDRLKWAYDGLDDKTEIDELAIKFHGFDGNTETKQLAYADHYCKSGGGRFDDLVHGNVPNSHMPTLALYRRMLEEWESCKNKLSLTKDDVIQITSAKTQRVA